MKEFIRFFAIFLLCTVAAYFLHNYLITRFHSDSILSLDRVYIFLGGFSAFLLLLLFLLSKKMRYEDQLGFFYLVGVVLKLILFSIVFREHIFSYESFTNEQSANLLIPIALTLFFEVHILMKILNKKDRIKNIK